MNPVHTAARHASGWSASRPLALIAAGLLASALAWPSLAQPANGQSAQPPKPAASQPGNGGTPPDNPHPEGEPVRNPPPPASV